MKYLGFLKKRLEISASDFPSILGFTLTVIARHPSVITEIKHFTMDLLMILAKNNFDLFSFIDGFEILINELLKVDMSEYHYYFNKITETIIFLLDKKKARNIIINNNYFGKIFAVFSDIKGKMN